MTQSDTGNEVDNKTDNRTDSEQVTEKKPGYFVFFNFEKEKAYDK